MEKAGARISGAVRGDGAVRGNGDGQRGVAVGGARER
jgi:hypothetical protein